MIRDGICVFIEYWLTSSSLHLVRICVNAKKSCICSWGFEPYKLGLNRTRPHFRCTSCAQVYREIYQLCLRFFMLLLGDWFTSFQPQLQVQPKKKLRWFLVSDKSDLGLRLNPGPRRGIQRANHCTTGTTTDEKNVLQFLHCTVTRRLNCLDKVWSKTGLDLSSHLRPRTELLSKTEDKIKCLWALDSFLAT